MAPRTSQPSACHILGFSRRVYEAVIAAPRSRLSLLTPGRMCEIRPDPRPRLCGRRRWSRASTIVLTLRCLEQPPCASFFQIVMSWFSVNWKVRPRASPSRQTAGHEGRRSTRASPLFIRKYCSNKELQNQAARLIHWCVPQHCGVPNNGRPTDSRRRATGHRFGLRRHLRLHAALPNAKLAAQTRAGTRRPFWRGRASASPRIL
jgi:hypothetical protein